VSCELWVGIGRGREITPHPQNPLPDSLPTTYPYEFEHEMYDGRRKRIDKRLADYLESNVIPWDGVRCSNTILRSVCKEKFDPPFATLTIRL
jgi:hypothetical protein